MAVEVYIHKMTEHMEVATILEWLVKEGERVEKWQPIMEVMTDKVTAELEAPASGILKGIRPGAVAGAEVRVGETLAFIAEPDEEVPSLPPLSAAVAARPATEAAHTVSAPPEGASPQEAGGVRASPVARRVAKELGVDISQVKGTGPQGRITEEDVRLFATQARTQGWAESEPTSATPAPVPAALEAEWLELSPVQRVTGERMRRSLLTAPQFALEMSADMTNALWLRDALSERLASEVGERPSITAILVKVVAATLRNHPRANAAFVDGRLQLFRQINIGVAVGTDSGLVVPVIREADRKSLAEVVAELRTFQEKARSLRFSAEDLAGGTFTISNLGMFGVDRFNAILNPPQSAILAVGRVIPTPVGIPDGEGVPVTGKIVLRPLMHLILTVDHRALDGVQGARFLAEIKERLEKPYFLL
jgi:pyruvate dehydrogenase E2 component (dihydrolipoamide acetyltransferase)